MEIKMKEEVGREVKGNGKKEIVLCPPCARLLVRNGLVNEVKFSWAYPPKLGKTNEMVRSLIIT